MGGRLPIDVPGAFQRFVGPDAVEIVAAPALDHLQFAGHGGQQRFKSGLRVEAGINQNLVPGGDHFAAFGESEGKARGELEAAFLLRAAPGEINVDSFFYRGASR